MSSTIDFESMLTNAKAAAKAAQRPPPCRALDSHVEVSPLHLLIDDGCLRLSLEFISVEGEDDFIVQARKGDHVSLGLNLRSVSILGGVPHPSGAIMEPLPSWISALSQRVASIYQLTSNPNFQVLVNVYEPGQGIARHQDGPLYDDQVSIVSLGGSTLIEFTGENGQEPASVFLPPRSLLVFSKRFYTSYTHEIIPRMSDCITSSCLSASVCGLSPGQVMQRGERERISFTFRQVSFVARVIDEFGPPDEETHEEIARRKAWWLRSISEEKKKNQEIS